jgi:transcriptional regulator with XRE-family HTH domain
VFRLEAGETNPQLATLRQVAAALKCSVRDLVAGSSESSSILAERVRQVRRVVEAGDETALRILDSGLEAAEALLDRDSPLFVNSNGGRFAWILGLNWGCMGHHHS